MRSASRSLRSLLVLACVLIAGTRFLAAQGSDTKGKYYFRKSCKTCHAKASEAVELTPLSKTQAQWRKFFEAGRHGKPAGPIAPKLATPEQLIDIKTFLVNHASDSPQPETCGG